MKIYIDNEFKCHVSNDGTRREVDTGIFDGKCREFIEGYRYVPEGETWTNKAGYAFSGEMIAPWNNPAELEAIQAAVEREQTEADAELAALIEEIYEEDLEDIYDV